VNPTLYIALRFLSHRKRAFLLSLCGVVFGVAIFICTQAQTQGFAQEFINANLGSKGALVMGPRFQPRYSGMIVPPKSSNANAAHRHYLEGIVDPAGIMRVSRQFANVVACSAVLHERLTARSGFESAVVVLFGIDPATHVAATDLINQIIEGNFDDFRNNPATVIVGSRLAELLDLRVGGTMQLLPGNGQYQRFNVAAIARTGIGAIDDSRVYCHRKIAQKLLLKPYSASMILYKLRDVDRAPALAKHFEMIFQHETEHWQEREAANLQLFVTLRLSAAITVSLIILLAGFGIFNVLTMTVLSKGKEIAILRSMGYRRRDISAIFLWHGAMIALAGSLVGCASGALLTWGVSHIPIKVRGLVSADHFLVSWDWRHYLWASVLAIIAVFISSYVPARRAAQLLPVVTLRDSSL
jgi:lipoprotein-releasing system permease protein